MTNAGTVQHDTNANRFELDLEGGEKAFVSYTESANNKLDLTHTEVPSKFEGQGIASKLVRGALDIAKSKGYSVIPSCPYIKKFIERNEEYQSLLDS
jgi:predicted GNAT family acetyltransferase